MEEINNKADLHGNALRLLAIRTPGSMKSTLSGKSSPRNSAPYRRLHTNRTPRKDSKAYSSKFDYLRGNRVVLWLLLITLWAYIGFHVQSKWAHGDHRKAELIGYKSKAGSADKMESTVTAENFNHSSGENLVVLKGKNLTSKNLGHTLAKKLKEVSSKQKQNTTKKSNRRLVRRLRKLGGKPKGAVVEDRTGVLEVGLIPRKNTSYGMIVGPFGKTEDSILGWSTDKRRGTCDRKGEFARFVWSRSFVLIFHELSMTGAPLSMMELATELLSCGGTVSAIVLSMKGGLITELDRRGIRVLRDRARFSFRTAMKADLIIAGSAVCSSWIDQYLAHFPAGSSKIIWWIMENRREYFDRSKGILSRVKMLTFLSESQSKQWLTWCEEEHIHLTTQPMIVPLSLNDELAFVTGIPCSLNTPAFSAESMLEKRNILRAAVRKEMGLGDNDMLVMSLSSINPTKGQRLFLESGLLVAEHNVSLEVFEKNRSFAENFPVVTHQNKTIITVELNSSRISQSIKQDNVQQGNTTSAASKKRRWKHTKLANILSSGNHTSNSLTRGDQRKLRNLLSDSKGQEEQHLKILIGSLGSKSNKVLYVKSILRLLSQHSNLSKLVLWTPATTRVASLYAAADVYVINAQGLGETFGRVTIEAMAFGLPVLGTDAGGTREIVEHKVTGLLHPVGWQGIQVLGQNIQYLLSNPSARNEMGMLGRKKVQEKYLKNHMYNRFAKVLAKCMKIK
ncbi:glycosyl transferase family 1 protein [Musa troglodytarum]|uniref:Glycosyl transferase family 1 protein n=1 Tax=Musa troglodytarum TaxID=320322 RepID=A0A9E7F114_9LILI|nr:glycosyl transferase family 1 protein [Musa troglodytarum]